MSDFLSLKVASGHLLQVTFVVLVISCFEVFEGDDGLAWVGRVMADDTELITGVIHVDNQVFFPVTLESGL